MEQKNGREKKAGLSEEQRQYLIKRFFVELLLFTILFILAVVKSFSAAEFAVVIFVAAAVSGGEIWCERNILRHYDTHLPKMDVKQTSKKDIALFFGIWVFFAAVAYLFQGKPSLTAGFLLGAILESGFCAAAALYLRKTSIKFK